MRCQARLQPARNPAASRGRARYVPDVPNPYREVHALQRRRAGGAGRGLLPVLAALAAVPLVRPVLLSFLDQGRLASGMEAVSLRLGFVMAATMALHTYTDLVRGPDRPVLDPHPVQPRLLLSAIALRTARERAYLPLVGALLLLPVGLDGHWVAWAGGVGVVAGAWLCALGVGFAVHLGGVWAARSPGLAALLDFLRGDNPRMQAALIYAPGVAVAAVGLVTGLASGGLASALDGWAPGWAFLGLPPALGVAGWLVAGPLAERTYVRATALLTEIDGMVAGREQADEERSVYLEWAARGRPELLRALRQGWRARRGWAMGAWALGALGALAGWSGAATAPGQAAAVAAGGALLLGALPARLADGDPPWLDRWLGVGGLPVARARATVAVLYAQGVVVPMAAALLIRHGLGSLWVVGLAEALALGGAGLGAGLAARWRGRAAWAYGPAALLAWAAVAGQVVS